MQQALRTVFQTWGLPQRLRVDNGLPWGSRGDLPTDLALWLLGLGIEMVWNRPAHPQENGIVERDHGTLKPWVEAHQCRDLRQLQQRLEQAARIQRAQFRGDDGRTRVERHPQLAAGAAAYDPSQETQQWQLARVAAFLARTVYRRRANHAGQISLYNRSYAVGRRYAQQYLAVRFDAATLEWVIGTETGQELIRHPAPEISAARICALEVTKRKVTKYQKPPA